MDWLIEQYGKATNDKRREVLAREITRESDKPRHDPWIEYDGAAMWCAERGLKGKAGDPLPTLMSSEACELINDDPEAFEARVRATAYAIAMNKLNIPED